MDVEQHQKKEDDSNDFGFIFAGIKETPDTTGVSEPVWPSGKALGW